VASDQPRRGEVNRLLRGTALPVDRDACDRLRPSGREHSGPGDVVGLLTDLADTSPDHVIDDSRVQPGALGKLPEEVR